MPPKTRYIPLYIPFFSTAALPTLVILASFFVFVSHSVWGQSRLTPARVQLDIIITQGVGYDVPHTLSRELARAGIENVTMRQQKPNDAVSITNTGTEAAPLWRVIAALEDSGSILLPDGTRVSSYQPTELAQWIQDLPEKMDQKKQSDQAPELSDFGLTSAATNELLNILKIPLNNSSLEKAPLETLRDCIRQLTCPVDISTKQLKRIQNLDPISEELQGLSCGTVLAYLLRPAGLCLSPRQTSSGVELSVVTAEKNVKPWPIGFQTRERESEVLPDMIQMVETGVDRSPAKVVLKALGERVHVPLLYDYNAMARHGIELDQVIVNIPVRKMSYLLIFKKVLTQARLKSELRMDEAGNPFFWITTIRPI